MELRAVIADDEVHAREELGFLLGQVGGVEVVGQAANGQEAVRLVEELQPDIAFLDVQMPGLDGFEVARRLLADAVESSLIFVTAYDQYAVEAFEVNAVDYLLKPVEPSRLERAVERARQRLAAGRSQTGLANQELEQIVELIAKRQSRRERLAITVGERFLLVQAEDIIYASLADEVITVVTGSLVGTSNYRTLDELHARLDPEVFWRVHRSHLVNINKIKEIVPWFSRNYILRMKDGKSTEIPVSRVQTKRLRDYLKL